MPILTNTQTYIKSYIQHIVALILLLWMIYWAIHDYALLYHQDELPFPNQVVLNSTQFFVQAVLYHAIIITLVIVIRPAIITQVTSFSIQPRAFFPLLLLTYVIAKGANFLPYDHLIPVSHLQTSLIQLKHLSLGLYLIVMLLSAYSEELFFRILPTTLNYKYPKMMAVLWQASFAITHLPTQGRYHIILHFILGMIFWASFQRKISLHTITAVHLSYNLLSLL